MNAHADRYCGGLNPVNLSLGLVVVPSQLNVAVASV
jgi:hypothetical protein